MARVSNRGGKKNPNLMFPSLQDRPALGAAASPGAYPVQSVGGLSRGTSRGVPDGQLGAGRGRRPMLPIDYSFGPAGGGVGGAPLAGPPLGVPTGISYGLPVGSINLTPSKYSGGFSTFFKRNIDNQQHAARQAQEQIARQQQIAAAEAANAAFAASGRGTRISSRSLFGGNRTETLADRRAREANGGGSSGSSGTAAMEYPAFLQGMLDEATRAQQEARAANEQRYKDILAGHDARIAGARGEIDQLGGRERLAIEDRRTQDAARAEQGLIDRGLGSTTIRSSVMRGYDAARDRALTGLAEDQSRLKLQYLPTLEGERLGFMERRNDVGPDPKTSIDLATQLGQTGFGVNGLNPAGFNPNGRPMAGGLQAAPQPAPAAALSPSPSPQVPAPAAPAPAAPAGPIRFDAGPMRPPGAAPPPAGGMLPPGVRDPRAMPFGTPMQMPRGNVARLPTNAVMPGGGRRRFPMYR